MLKTILQIFVFVPFIMAQGYWSDYVNIKTAGREYCAFADSLPVRKEPGLTKPLSFYLRCGDKVSILAKTELLDNLIGIKEYWYQVSANDKEGYVWGGGLADYCTEIKGCTLLVINKGIVSRTINEGFTLLVRNNGIINQSLDLKVFGPKLKMTQIRLPAGPVNSDDGMTSDLIDPKLFAPRPKMLFSLGYFVFSEIEMGFDRRTICTIDSAGVIWTHFSWIPSSCDPPMCMETFVLFPGDSLLAKPDEKRPRYESITNGIRLVMHDWDMDDSLSHEYSVKNYLWDGRGFKGE